MGHWPLGFRKFVICILSIPIMHQNIKTAAGAKTRLRVNFILPEGVEEPPEARFFLDAGGGRTLEVRAEEGGGAYVFPALEAGHYAYEFVAAGSPTVFGHLLVRPSALPQDGAELDAAMDVDLAVQPPVIELTMTPGPRGEKGEPGEPGASAYEAWLAAGHDGSEAEFLDSLRPTPDEAEAAAERALYELEPVGMSTQEGASNATCQWIELDAQHVPQGKLERISLRARSAGNPASTSYLGLWELGEDGATWSYLGSSTNNPAQAANAMAEWLFDEGIVLSGRKLRIMAQAARSDAWAAGPTLGVRTSSAPEGDATMAYRNGQGYAFLPELEIAVQRRRDKYAPLSHAEDAAAHVTPEEREAWNAKADAADVGEATARISQQLIMHTQSMQLHVYAAEHAVLAGLREGTQAGALPVLYVKGTEGTPLLTVRGNQTNVTVSGSQLSFNVPQLTIMSDCPALYRYDAATGATEAWLACAPDAQRLAPLGIAEAGTHVGAPSLPLRLRGSEILFNGEPLAAGGGAQVAIDPVPTEGGGNAVSSGGAWSYGLHPSAGESSLAGGEGAQAYGACNLALGCGAVAGGSYSVADGAPAPGDGAADYAMAVGWQAEAWDAEAVALGAKAKAAQCSVSVGSDAQAAGGSSVAIGKDCFNAGNGVSIGYGTKGQHNAVVAGSFAEGGNYSVSIGQSAYSGLFEQAVAIGYCARSGEYGAIVGAQAQGLMHACSFGHSALASNYGVAAGSNAFAATFATAVGNMAVASANATAVGCYATAADRALALGDHAMCGAAGSAAIGFRPINGDAGCAAISVAAAEPAEDLCLLETADGGGWVINDLIAGITVTQLYLIGAGSELANQYTGGEAGLGFIEYAPGRCDGSAGSIVRRGCRKLSELLTDHADDFSPNLAPPAPEGGCL